MWLRRFFIYFILYIILYKKSLVLYQPKKKKKMFGLDAMVVLSDYFLPPTNG